MPKKNYVEDYIFATQVAKNAGNTTNLSKVMGQGSLCYKRMKIAINSSGIVWSPNSQYDEENPDVVRKSWKNIINSATNLNYDAQTAELKEK